ncbi:hypothetical protein GYMLUDRAFT_945836 [Collybiopsis luxurians FD-317 M1]|uniref:Uncharacterized protein n=1 Tax=Collybiopsis luxurians FD-317 M1 TaxID=944289 RepID=A0A0D0BTS5_9AGAR|nr:hypothetical protein GYMLUDRAFT_945836 [Collybiopsis luxurians FD-317 M1]
MARRRINLHHALANLLMTRLCSHDQIMLSTSNGLTAFLLSTGTLLVVDPEPNVAVLNSGMWAAGMSIGAGKGVGESRVRRTSRRRVRTG